MIAHILGDLSIMLHGTLGFLAIAGSWSGMCSEAHMVMSFGRDKARSMHIWRGSTFIVVQPWSNGQTEGQINKLKMVKRQMYGRAKIDLLQARLIGAP